MRFQLLVNGLSFTQQLYSQILLTSSLVTDSSLQSDSEIYIRTAQTYKAQFFRTTLHVLMEDQLVRAMLSDYVVFS